MSDIAAATSDVECKVIDLLSAKLGTRPTREDDLAILNLDSLALAEFSVELEKLFAIKIDEGILEVQTVGDVIDYTSQLLGRSK
ncbi:MAG: acyl carrier protein [Pirellulales bacterium]